MTVIESLAADIAAVKVRQEPLATTVEFYDHDGIEIANRPLAFGDRMRKGEDGPITEFITREGMHFATICCGNVYQGSRT